jgi:hypothetical protein
MSSIDTRSAFFPKGRSVQTESTKGGSQVGGVEKRNSTDRASEIMDKTAKNRPSQGPDSCGHI